MATQAKSGSAAETAAEPKKGRRRITKRKVVEAHVRSYFDALSARDALRMAQHWREDGVADIVPLGVLRGREEITGLFRELFAAVPDLETTITRVVAGEREAAVEWRMTGTFSGEPFQGVDATGKRIDLRGLDLIEVEDAENVSVAAYYDGMAFARQIGLMPPQDSRAERGLKSAFNAATRARRVVAERSSALAQRRDGR
jgi:steroid delta-isomerase-like uncharacterized protein